MLVKHEPKIQNNVGNWWLLSAESLIVAKLCRLSTISEPKNFARLLAAFLHHSHNICLLLSFAPLKWFASSLFKRICRLASHDIFYIFFCIWPSVLKCDFMSTRFASAVEGIFTETQVGGQLKMTRKMKRMANPTYKCNHCIMQMLRLITANCTKLPFPWGTAHCARILGTMKIEARIKISSTLDFMLAIRIFS